MSQHDSEFYQILAEAGLTGQKTSQPLSGFGDEDPNRKRFQPMPKAHYLPATRRLIEEDEDDILLREPTKPLHIPPSSSTRSKTPKTPKKKMAIAVLPPSSQEEEESRHSQSQLAEAESLESLTPPLRPRVRDARIADSPAFDDMADELLDPENVEPIESPPPPDMPYSQYSPLDPSLIVDEYHLAQIRNTVPMPPFKPITGEEKECLPKQTAKTMFNFEKETQYRSTFPVYYIEHKYDPIVNYIHSYPGGHINYLMVDLPINPHLPLTLAMIANLTIQDDSSFVRYMGEMVQLHYQEPTPSIVYFSFQIKARTIFLQPGTLNELTITSPVYCISFDHLVDEFYDKLLQWFDYLRTKEGNTEYDRFFTDNYNQYHVTQWNILHFSIIDSGGCGQIQQISADFYKYIDSPVTRNNYCFFAVLLRDPHFNQAYSHWMDYNEKLEKIRSDAGLILNNQPVFFNQLQDVVLNLKFNLFIYTEYQSPYKDEQFHKRITLTQENSFYVEGSMAQVKMLFLKRGGLGHFYEIKDLEGLLRLRCCRYCFHWLDNQSQSFFRHDETCKPCPMCKKRMTKNHKCDNRVRNPKNKTISVNNKKQKPWNKNVWFADFETFTQSDGIQKVYSAALVCIDKLLEYQKEKIDLINVYCENFYGRECLARFVDFILQIKGKCTIVFYNGCRFDFSFILNELVRRRIPLTLKKDEQGNTIQIFNTKNIRFMDLYRFTLSSLASACKSFNVPKEYCKTDFDHSKVYDFSSALHWKNEVAEYNKYDVISMGILYIIIAKNFESFWKISLKEYISLSQSSYDVWINQLPKEYVKTLTPPREGTYNFLRECLYGGRVYCGQPYYQSSIVFVNQLLYEWPFASEEERKRKVEKWSDSGEQLKVYDMGSLYPMASQVGGTLNLNAKGMFPVGNYEFLPEDRFGYHLSYFLKLFHGYPIGHREEDILHRCFYEVDLECPRDIDVPFILSHENVDQKTRKLAANLKPKYKQCYSGIILTFAVREFKYKVTRIYQILKFGLMRDVFHSYIKDVMQRKDECHAKGDAVGRNMYKMMGNSLYGKQSEHAHFLEQEMHYTDEFMKFFTHERIIEGDVKVETIFNKLEPIAYYVSSPQGDPRKIFNKCPQLGVIILDYSKIIMALVMKQLRLFGDNKLLYTDTDSIFIKKSVRDQDNSPIWGDTFGKMKDEYPDVIWVHGVFYAPKTYALLGLCKKTYQVVSLIKAKGAPQDKAQTKNNGLYYIHELEESCKKSKYSIDDLKHVMFYLLEEDRIIDQSTYIKYDWFFGMIMQPDRRIVVDYGTFKKIMNDVRFLVNQDLTAFYIQKLRAHRTLNNNDPWNMRGENSNLELTRVVGRDGKTYPAGHFKDPFYQPENQ